MKLTAKVKLLPTPDQYRLLKETLETANAACNAISEAAWQRQTFAQFALHKLTYHPTRQQFPLAAQIVVRCISKVADAYKLDKKTKRAFKPHGAISYDDRVLNWRVPSQQVSIWTLAGRETIPFAAGERQLELLQRQDGESDLCYIDGVFYLFATCDIETPAPVDVEGVLGVDLGVANIAVDSDGNMHSGKAVNKVRHRHRRLRQKLQKKQTDSARRKLKRLAGKERRFANDVNHCISKQLVANAQDTRRALALEELGGIRERFTVRRGQRAALHSWSFFQLRSFIEYKAQRAGIPVILVDPRNTSRTCPECGCIDKHNRPSQSVFKCTACGFADHADRVAATNIGRRALVSAPNVGTSAG